MDKVLSIMKVKTFIKESKTELIKYDWDSGHCYSYIDHPIVDEVEDYDELTDKLNAWLYSNDECPPCAIYVNKDGTSSQGCCNDTTTHSVDETNDIIEQLTQHCKDDNCMKSLKYLVNREQ